MKALNFDGISSSIETIRDAAKESSSIGRSELIDVSLISFAKKNTYASEDTDESIQELADQIEEVGLLKPLGVVKEGCRYRLFDGERRFRAVTEKLHYTKVPCTVFEGVSSLRAQLMLHIANGSRSYSPAKRLQLYEEYHELLQEMKEAGEFTGGVQKGIADLLGVSDRQVRTYRNMSENLTNEEKEAVSQGKLDFGEAQRTAQKRRDDDMTSGRADEKSGSTSAFLDEEERKVLLGQVLPCIWDMEEIYKEYVRLMPTPTEAIKDILKPKYYSRGGTFQSKDYDGSFVCDKSLLNIRVSGNNQVLIKYAEIDKCIRQMYRESAQNTIRKPEGKE